MSRVSLQNSPGYAEAMEWLLDVFEAYETQAMSRRDGNPAPATQFTATHTILANFVTLMERFANGRSVENIQKDIGDVYDDVAAQPELRALWVDVDAWIRRVLLERGYVETIECDIAGRTLRARGKEWLQNELYAAHWDTLCWGLSTWLGIATEGPKKGRDGREWFRDDPLTRRLEADYNRLVSALFKDSRGWPTFKRHVWTELAAQLFPAVKRWGYVTLPRVELSTPKIELVLENVHVALANVLPSLLTLEEHDILTCSPFDELRNECEKGSRTRFRFQVSQVQAEVRNALIALDWKTLSLKDSGISELHAAVGADM